MKENISPYELVHMVSKLAKEKVMEDRNPIEQKKGNLFKEVNKPKKNRNYVQEAFDEITKEMGEY